MNFSSSPAVLKCAGLGRALADCWLAAEQRVISDVRDAHWGPDEPFVTSLFRGHLRKAVEDASAEGAFERALRADLIATFRDLAMDRQITGLANRLFATVSFHGAWHEGRVSAADIAVVVRRPMIHRVGPDRITIRREYPRALLGQAKLGRPRKRSSGVTWGTLTKPQRRLVPARLDYYALLLYRVLDFKGTRLAPFTWQLCSGHRASELRTWLKTNSFPHVRRSAGVIRDVAMGRIGTDDSSVTDLVASPATQSWRSIDIRIDWHDDDAPPPSVPIKKRISVSTQTKVLLRRC